MIDHFGITVSDIKVSRIFYQAVLSSLGYVVTADFSTSVGFGIVQGSGKSSDPGGDFWLAQGTPMSPRVHFAFAAPSHDHVGNFYASGIKAGGVDNGKPGFRLQYHPHYYATFLLDPDGYNVEAVCHQ